MIRFKRWAKLLLMAILLLSVTCSASCNRRSKVVYRPVTDQVFLVPPGSVIIAPDGRLIISDKGGKRLELERMVLPYDGVILSDGYFLKLYRARVEEKEKEK